ncbi:hypothetical protein LTR66_012596, partial [Elasticomyces elasticus]
MNGTPRLRSAFPSTPQTDRRTNGTPAGISKLASSLPDVSALRDTKDPSSPMIPFDTVDAPSQRLYVAAFYAALIAYRLYDNWQLWEEETESLWLFMKWVAIDGVFLYGLPSLRIPWLEWSPATTTMLFLLHAIFDAILMFRIVIPLGPLFVALGKMMYDKELAIDEHRVRPATVMHNSSLILGKQIIHILPEGSAMLNPKQDFFCLDSSRPAVHLPIQINGTDPVAIDLMRIDLDTSHNETIHISSRQIRTMTKEAMKLQENSRLGEPLVLRYTAKKTGLYVLAKVIDKSNLEVQRRRLGDTMLVACPRAVVKATKSDRCKGELSDVELEVTGVPPLKIKYRKTVNRAEHEATFQSIQPEDFISPLADQDSEALSIPNRVDVSWARSQSITVPFSEVLGTSGKWSYSIEEVQDAFGNVVNYMNSGDDEHEKPMPKSSHLSQSFTVHERPSVALRGCDPQHPLNIARGTSANLPVSYSSTGKGEIQNSGYTLGYLFTPIDDLLPTGEHSESAQLREIKLKNAQRKPEIKESGLYTLTSIATDFCSGEVLEPASCLLQNPPEPDLSISTEEIYDKCAGSPIGLRVDLDLLGTPPFDVQYRMTRKGDKHHLTQFEQVKGLRGQLQFTPATAGHYTYEFVEVSDAIYRAHSLLHKRLIIEQDVKPSASAHFADVTPRKLVCVDESVSFEILLQGEGPFVLEYELVHGGKREKHEVENITGQRYTIETARLKNGGDYTLALASVTDRMGCKEFLKEEARISVRHQRPKGYFGLIEGKRDIRTLEGKEVQLPLGLTGEGPWTVSYHNLRDESKNHTIKVTKANDKLAVKEDGVYEIIQVKDAVCPGVVDQAASRFMVDWIPRPRLSVAESSLTTFEDGKYIRREICEGEEDLVEVHIDGELSQLDGKSHNANSGTGSPPYELKYEEHLTPDQGTRSLRNKELNAALGVASIRLDTAQSGLYEYRFTELADYNYDHDPKRYTPLVVQQRVNPRPS